MRHEHILVIRFSALGDVAMTVPVVWALAQEYPDVRITVLSRPFARTFFEDLAPNVNFMEADVRQEYHGVKGLNALYRRLVAKQLTHVADLHSVLRSEYLRMRFNLGRFRVEHIDKHRQERRRLVSRTNKVMEPLPTPFQNYLDVFSRLGFPIHHLDDFRSIFPPEGGNLNLLPRIIGEKRSWEQWIGIAPFAAHEGKVYPTELMEQVVGQLIARYPKCRIFFFGRGRQEDEVFPQWVKRWPQCVYAGWHLETMHQELTLMSHLDVMLSMDSANMHMASLVGVPVVSIWGATHPLAGFMGFHQNPDNAIGLDLDCRPCSIYGQRPCQWGDYRCLTGIPPKTIVDKIEKVINSRT
ncbi:MAG: glycosyltransferase family 9 protein [Prevotella sp.]|nr:glycosyltransferase family 9 protein [Prevotella sp.]